MTDLATAQADTQPDTAEDALDALLDSETDEGGLEPTQAPTEAAKTPNGDTQDSEEQPNSLDDSEDAPQDADTDDAQEEQDDVDPAQPTLDPPARWDADGKALFATLPAEAQTYLANREKQTQGEITRRQQENAKLQLELKQAKAAPDTELTRVLNEVKSAYTRDFSGVTDERLYEALATGQITQTEFSTLRQERTAHEQAIQQLEAQAETRQAEQLKDHQETRTLELQANAPELVNDPQAQQLVIGFLEKAGYDAEDLRWAGSRDLITAHKAAQWDALQAAKSSAKPAATRTGKAISAKPAQSGNVKAQRKAALLRKGTPQALEQLLDMELDE